MRAFQNPYSKAIGNAAQFVIPLFQGDYSWTEAECMAKGEEWQSPLEPPPGDPRACWTEEEMDMWRRGEGEPLIEKYGLLEEEHD